MRFACEYYMFDVTYYYIYRHMDRRLYYVKYIADRWRTFHTQSFLQTSWKQKEVSLECWAIFACINGFFFESAFQEWSNFFVTELMWGWRTQRQLKREKSRQEDAEKLAGWSAEEVILLDRPKPLKSLLQASPANHDKNPIAFIIGLFFPPSPRSSSLFITGSQEAGRSRKKRETISCGSSNSNNDSLDSRAAVSTREEGAG